MGARQGEGRCLNRVYPAFFHLGVFVLRAQPFSLLVLHCVLSAIK